MFKVSYNGTLGKLATHPGCHISTHQFGLPIFVESSSDHFYQIILTSENSFREDDSYFYRDNQH